jgi:GH15 family glucan-1,4-alpha-glucosidase
MDHLTERSIAIILENQSPNGAYVASPNFSTYHYCWFRDGAFTAFAMDLVGQHESARKFHSWAARSINERASVVRAALAKAGSGQPFTEDEILHTRYRLDGSPDTSGEWGNFQLDGFGAWLWALGEHRRLSDVDSLQQDWLAAAGLAADYLKGLWRLPCYDCWEEFPEFVHPHTLAAIYGGLHAYALLLDSQGSGIAAGQLQEALEAIRSELLAGAAQFGHFVKFAGSAAVDASLLSLAVPYGVVSPDDPRMLATVSRIEETLVGSGQRSAGGVHRYAEDTYYGGGEWVLLTAWLGWYYCELAGQNPGRAAKSLEKARGCLDWVERQAGGEGQGGWLPEQIPANLNDPSYYRTWLSRWGPIANPLLWSHAKHLILRARLSGLAPR